MQRINLRYEEYILNEDWPYFYLKKAFESVHKDIPHIIITRITISNPKGDK